MTLHNRMTAFSFAAVVALAALVPSPPANAAEEVGLQEECVPFRMIGQGASAGRSVQRPSGISQSPIPAYRCPRLPWHAS